MPNITQSVFNTLLIEGLTMEIVQKRGINSVIFGSGVISPDNYHSTSNDNAQSAVPLSNITAALAALPTLDPAVNITPATFSHVPAETTHKVLKTIYTTAQNGTSLIAISGEEARSLGGHLRGHLQNIMWQSLGQMNYQKEIEFLKSLHVALQTTPAASDTGTNGIQEGVQDVTPTNTFWLPVAPVGTVSDFIFSDLHGIIDVGNNEYHTDSSGERWTCILPDKIWNKLVADSSNNTRFISGDSSYDLATGARYVHMREGITFIKMPVSQLDAVETPAVNSTYGYMFRNDAMNLYHQHYHGSFFDHFSLAGDFSMHGISDPYAHMSNAMALVDRLHEEDKLSKHAFNYLNKLRQHSDQSSYNEIGWQQYAKRPYTVYEFERNSNINFDGAFRITTRFSGLRIRPKAIARLTLDITGL